MDIGRDYTQQAAYKKKSLDENLKNFKIKENDKLSASVWRSF